MPGPTQDGLVWQQTPLALVPAWTRDPLTDAIESVSRQKLKIAPDEPCTVAFHAAGLFNKVYLVHIARRSFVMRVTLPVYPRHKTRAEVVTLRWVRENTSVPVPKVFAFDDSNENEIGFEWILMEFIQGTSARKRWRTMTMEQKVALTKRFAVFQFELSGLEKQKSAFIGIGTLDSSDIDLQVEFKASQTAATPGRLVSHEFFMGDHLDYDIPRGPFRSSHDWLSAILRIVIQHQTLVLGNSEDDDDVEDAEAILPVARALLALLPKVFSPDSTSVESSVLYHHDLNLNNILVNEAGDVVAVLDWECVSALPLWMLSKVPKFLDDQTREEEPQRDIYRDETAEHAVLEEKKRDDPAFLDNEGKNELYWIHKMEYETTQLRKVYKTKLKELCTDWVSESPLQEDFYESVLQCDGIWVQKVRKWAEQIEADKLIRFKNV